MGRTSAQHCPILRPGGTNPFCATAIPPQGWSIRAVPTRSGYMSMPRKLQSNVEECSEWRTADPIEPLSAIETEKNDSQAVRCPGTPEKSNHRQAHAWWRHPEQRSSSCFGLVPEFGISGHECTQKQILCRVQSYLTFLCHVVAFANYHQHPPACSNGMQCNGTLKVWAKALQKYVCSHWDPCPRSSLVKGER